MDERLEKALDFSNYMVTLNNQRRFYKEKYEQDCLHYYNGSQFTVDKELICFCKIMLLSEQDSVVLIDDNSKPVEIENLEEFLNDVMNVYFVASNSYLSRYNDIVKNKQIEKMVDL